MIFQFFYFAYQERFLSILILTVQWYIALYGHLGPDKWFCSNHSASKSPNKQRSTWIVQQQLNRPILPWVVVVEQYKTSTVLPVGSARKLKPVKGGTREPAGEC